jgi:hypothetical protein
MTIFIGITLPLAPGLLLPAVRTRGFGLDGALAILAPSDPNSFFQQVCQWLTCALHEAKWGVASQTNPIEACPLPTAQCAMTMCGIGAEHSQFRQRSGGM